MPRNGSGTYTLPQPAFVSNTVISSSAMNSDLSDIASALTTSIATDGQSTLTVAIKNPNGTAGTPGVSFAGDATTGLYLPSAGSVGISAGGVSIGTSTGSATTWNLNTTIRGTLSCTSATCTVGGNQVSVSMVLLNTVTGSGVAALSDTTSLTSAYTYYKVLFDVTVATSTANLSAQIAIASVFQSSGYGGAGQAVNTAGALTQFNASTAFILGSSLSNSNDAQGEFIIYNPSSAANRKQITGLCSYVGSGGLDNTAYFGGAYGSNSAINGIRILGSTGNISGTMKIYGII